MNPTRRIIPAAALAAAFVTASLQAGGFSSDFSSAPGGMEFSGDAAVTGGYLQLNDTVNFATGSVRFDDLDPGEAVQSFDVTFTTSVAPNGGADGWGLFFTTATGGGYGLFTSFESNNVPGGLAVQYQEFNGAFMIRAGSTVFSIAVPKEAMTDGTARPVTFSWDAVAGATASFTAADTTVYSVSATAAELATAGLDIVAGYQFTLGGRTGGAAAYHRFDDLAITTSLTAIPEPATWATVSGVAALGLAVRRRRSSRL